MQDLWIRQKPEVLAALREGAQSVESSNRIEGVTIEINRLRPVVLGKARPRDRSEEELSGYRRALDWIFSRKGPVTIHADGYPQVAHIRPRPTRIVWWRRRGRMEKAQQRNYIIEILPGGERSALCARFGKGHSASD